MKKPTSKQIIKAIEQADTEKKYLHNGEKMVLVQIGRTFYALKEWETITVKEIWKLESILKQFDVHLLKEGEN